MLLAHQHEQQPQSLRNANQAETDSYCLDRRYVIPHQAAFNDPFLDQNVKTPKPLETLPAVQSARVTASN
jgi:hypothetical protein